MARRGFEALFEEEFDFVVHSLLRLGVREADVEDVSQELFIHVHARLADYDPTRPVRPWLFSFACRSAANYRRLARNRREVSGGDVERDPAIEETPEGRASATQELERVQRVLDTMNDDQRIALIMHDIHEFTAPEIAEALGVPLNTVYSRVRKARIAFKRSVKWLERGRHA